MQNQTNSNCITTTEEAYRLEATVLSMMIKYHTDDAHNRSTLKRREINTIHSVFDVREYNLVLSYKGMEMQFSKLLNIHSKTPRIHMLFKFSVDNEELAFFDTSLSNVNHHYVLEMMINYLDNATEHVAEARLNLAKKHEKSLYVRETECKFCGSPMGLWKISWAEFQQSKNKSHTSGDLTDDEIYSCGYNPDDIKGFDLAYGTCRDCRSY